MKNIVTQEWLYSHFSRSQLIICDCRFLLGQPLEGQKQYEQDHIEGAIYVDLERDLSQEKSKHGGRHPLPAINRMQDTMGRLGIKESSTVVAYDDQGGAMAARLWWMLKYLGHENVFILDEGYAAWKVKGYPVAHEATVLTPVTYVAQKPKVELVTMEDVHKLMNANDSLTALVDSRDEKRYTGEEEPVDKKAGHIPTAMNMPWMKNLENGKWKSADELRRIHQSIKGKKEVIVYCGSGVTACANIVAMQEAGVTNVKLYSGSWSDWSSYDENPIATEKE
ncbi:Rhodanese domain-containing protein [Fictibacillus macauensis ZFHKF-1]|uniref:Rhodanese domain-containing protein n=1 Tax=Fictibacillus macauensis ZFHKF-1 TaxID=1196324 RepID=I8UJ33_9BACL|nr:sulfurtransferase [Fictibacillus macauensis]EIT86843.1 Rhodanese domain-containing protein [Fictibacillus macauensis ZFHKF-1]